MNNGGEANSETIPLDLIIEILTRLPTKSIARFCCVSKLWSSTLSSPIFTESFYTMSLSKPKLLFTCQKEGETFFFTSPQPHKSSTLTANYHMKFPINDPYDIYHYPVCGLVCGKNQRINLEGITITVLLICNPSTGQFLTLPEVKTIRKDVITFLGYDPINKQFKVLCMTYDIDTSYSENHQVLTLGTGKELSWRMIECDIPHCPMPREHPQDHYLYDHRCINGVLYYVAGVDRGDQWSLDIVCFDIRSEKFKCISNAPTTNNSVLINYKGKLAMLQKTRIRSRIRLLILKDAEKHEWSSYIYVMPPPWKKIFEKTKFYFVGTTSRGEIVLSPTYISESFYLLYYNPEKNNITRVEIQGMDAFKTRKAYIFLDYVEDVRLMEASI